MGTTMQQQFTDSMLAWADSSFKYILIVFNILTLVVVYLHKRKQKTKKQHHVLFVTAHPDDEVMYFRPAIRSIAKDYFVHLLCLTGKGTERERELIKSAQLLGIHKVECVSNQNLIDSLSTSWPHLVIQQVITTYIHENSIKAIFTFDQYGISNHPNHKSISQALQSLQYPSIELKILTKKPTQLSLQQVKLVEEIRSQSIKIYYLNSVNVIRKYSGVMQVVFALVRDLAWVNVNVTDAYRVMAVHESQFVWYRKLWVLFSQYTYINTFSLSRMKVNRTQTDTVTTTKTATATATQNNIIGQKPQPSVTQHIQQQRVNQGKKEK